MATWSAQVRYAEVDQQGLVFNAHYLTWADEACTAGFEEVGSPYDALLARKPGEAEAVLGKAWAQLLQRAAHLDPSVVLMAAQGGPDDVDAQTAAADVEILSEQIQPAIDRLVGFVKRSSGAERDAARQHLLDLFSVLDPEDERIITGRRALSNALY